MELFVQALAAGLVIGCVYCLISIGLTMIFSIMRIVNFAHGGFFMVGGYIGWYVINHFVSNYWLAVLIAVVLGGILGFLTERIYSRIYGKGLLSMFMISLGLVLILQNGAQIVFGPISKSLLNFYPTVRQLGVVRINDQRLIIVGLTLITLAGVFLFFKYTKMGKAMRATAGNRRGAGVVGIKAERMSMFAFIGGIALTAFAGVLLAPLYSLLPTIGDRLTGVAFTCIVIGGIGSIEGAAISGFAIGIVENIFGTYFSTAWAFAPMFVLLLLVLVVKPLGLFGKEVA
jgi:branched-chain amino acid transport system permease protein